MSKIKKNDFLDWSVETINTPPAEMVEKNVCIDEKTIKNKELVRIEMNLIQFPIFSKNTQRKINQAFTYIFNEDKRTYMTISPNAGDYIPGEMEEKVFIALMQIMKEKGMERKIVISSVELKNKLKMTTRRYLDILKSSLIRLGSTNYTFKNTFYSSELKGTINKEINTSIFNIDIISLEEEQNLKYRKQFKDKRVKVVYEIEFSEHFYNNIIQKGYLVFNGNTLLEIDGSVARTIYMLIEKLRYNKVYLKIDVIYLINRIPLQFDKKNATRTVNTLKKAFEELREKKLIENYNFIKESTWESSEVEFFFPELLLTERQQMFYDDKNDFEKIKKLNDFTVSDMKFEILKENKKIKKEEIEEIVPTENIYNPNTDKAKEYYNILSEDEKSEIEKIVEEQYYKKCGQRSKVQTLAFSHSKKSLIIKYIIDNELYKELNRLKKLKSIEKEEEKVETIEEELNIEELKKYTEETITVSTSLFNVSEDVIRKIKFLVYNEITPMIVEKTLTKEILKEIIKKYVMENITY